MELPSELNQKYELRGELGSGAMGTVYDVVDRVIERRVAIKVVRRPNPNDPDAVETHARFRREAQAAGRLSHANIVAVYDYGENADKAWIVMELVEGGSLKGRLDRNERFTIPDIVRLMDQILAALAYSHGRGVVHRDIKPANIMLTTEGAVKIADFGIARLENSSMTQLGQMIGTPAYMAPEQFRGETVDARADIWAAGVVLYQLLTGDKPFDGGFNTVMHKALHTEPVAPSQLSVTAPRSFDAVIARALAKRPEDRFPDARAFAEAIHAAASMPSAGIAAGPAPSSDATIITTGNRGGLPPLPGMGPGGPGPATPPVGPTPPGPGTKPAKPPPTPGGGSGRGIGIAIALVLLLLAGGGGGYWFLVYEPQRVEAERQRLEAEARAAAERARLEAERIAREAAETAAQRQAREAAEREAEARRQQDAREAEARRLQAEREAADAALRAAQQREREAQNEAERQRLAAARAAAEEAQRQAQQREAAERQRLMREQAERERLAREEAERQRLAAEQAERERLERERRQQPGGDGSGPTLADLRATGQAIAQQACTLLAWSATERQLTVAGAVRRDGEAAIRRILAERRIPTSAVRLELQVFDAPYCPALDLLRPAIGPVGAAPRAALVGQAPLAKGELMQIDVEMPDWPAQLYVAYFMSSGEVAHLVPSRPMTRGERMRVGERTATDQGFPVDEPYGTDLAVVIASDRPLFPAGRPIVEPMNVYLSALAQSLAAVRAAGGRVQVRPVVVETVERRR